MKSLKLFLFGSSLLLAANATATPHYFYTEDPQAYMHVLLYVDDLSAEPVPPHVVSGFQYSGQIYIGDGYFNLMLDEANDRYYFDLLFTKPAETNPIYPFYPDFFTSKVEFAANSFLPTEFGYGYNPVTEIISLTSGPALEITSFSFPDLELPSPLYLGGRSNLGGRGGHLQFFAGSGVGTNLIPGAYVIEIGIHVPSLVYAGNSKPGTDVPEPSSFILLLTGLVGLIKSRLRDAPRTHEIDQSQ